MERGNMPRADAVLQSMLDDHGCVPDLVTCTALVHGWASAGDMPRAERVVERMAAAGVPPDAWVFSTLMQVGGQSRWWWC